MKNLWFKLLAWFHTKNWWRFGLWFLIVQGFIGGYSNGILSAFNSAILVWTIAMLGQMVAIRDVQMGRKELKWW